MSWIIAYLYIAGFILAAHMTCEGGQRSPKRIEWVFCIVWPLSILGGLAVSIHRRVSGGSRPCP